MALEPFLTNPPKSRPKHKAMRGKKHRILAFEHGGVIHTSPLAKLVRPGLKINPFRKLHHRRKFSRNPFGEELMFVGTNPMRGVRTMTMRKHHKKHRKSYKHNPHRKHHSRKRYHRNPMSSMKSLIPAAVSGTVGAFAVRAIPNLLSGVAFISGLGTIGQLVLKGAVIVGGAKLADKFVKKSGVSDGWVIGSTASVLSELVQGFIPTGTAVAGYGMYETATPVMIAEGGPAQPYSDGLGMYENATY